MTIDSESAKQQLLALREQLDSLESTSRDAADTVELDQTRMGRLSRMDALQAQEISKESHRRRQELRRRIAPALRRIDSGEYGYCADCDEEIAARRLAFDPTCVLCVKCAEQRE
ncbi:MAG: TraR/DksA family transcriptional regulator [Gammaproteobacteria bacterium]|nr:TraR/DksA family transcriptional regulator [Gammaproteobacteria bacterium]